MYWVSNKDGIDFKELYFISSIFARHFSSFTFLFGNKKKYEKDPSFKICLNPYWRPCILKRKFTFNEYKTWYFSQWVYRYNRSIVYLPSRSILCQSGKQIGCSCIFLNRNTYFLKSLSYLILNVKLVISFEYKISNQEWPSQILDHRIEGEFRPRQLVILLNAL